jgi:glycosyltransferase involved in cell wall biosynthesis
LHAYLKAFGPQDNVCLVIKDIGVQSFYSNQNSAEYIRAIMMHPNTPEIVYLDQELSYESMPGLYSACNCLVHPYRGEGFGLPVLEGMASGLPVVVTAGGATDDFATDQYSYRIPSKRESIGDNLDGIALAGTGWLLEPDVEALAARMRWVFEHQNEARQMGERGGEYARKEWNWEKAAQIAAQRLRELGRLAT